MYGWRVALDSHNNDEMHESAQMLVFGVVDRIQEIPKPTVSSTIRRVKTKFRYENWFLEIEGNEWSNSTVVKSCFIVSQSSKNSISKFWPPLSVVFLAFPPPTCDLSPPFHDLWRSRLVARNANIVQ